jgi:hypothetical protein
MKKSLKNSILRYLGQLKNLVSPLFCLRLVFVSLVVLLLVSGIQSCADVHIESMDKAIVQVWEGESLVSNGIVVGDGNKVLTLLDYNFSVPDNLYIVVQNQDKYEATIAITDFRTGMTLLDISGGSFTPTPTKDALMIKPDQKVVVFGWSRPFQRYEETGNGKQAIFGDPIFTQTSAVTTDFTIDSPFRFGINYPSETPLGERAGIGMRDIVTDLKGNVLGFVGNSYWGLFPPPSFPGWLPPVVSISAALDLLSENANQKIWARGPIGFIFAGPNYNTAYGQAPEYYDEAATEIEKLLNTAGELLSVAELNVEDYTSFFPTQGKAVTAEYVLPVSLRNIKGDLLALAKWIFIRWGVIGQSVYVVYGAAPYSPDGAFELSGDPTNLDFLVHPGSVRQEVVPP